MIKACGLAATLPWTVEAALPTRALSATAAARDAAELPEKEIAAAVRQSSTWGHSRNNRSLREGIQLPSPAAALILPNDGTAHTSAGSAAQAQHIDVAGCAWPAM